MEPAMSAAMNIAPADYLEIIKLGLNLGFCGVILILWYFDKQQTDRILQQYREESLEQRKMYENNVELVNRFVELSSDLKELITVTTQTMAQLVDRVELVCRETFKT